LGIEGAEPGFEHGRIRPLDGLRGMAALLVIAYHYIFVQFNARIGSPVYYLKGPLKFAWSGVDLFFVLSGFLITTILIQARNSPNYFSTFYMRRVTRIFPVYFLTLLSFLVARSLLPPGQDLIDGAMPLWTYVLFVQNIAMWLKSTPGAEWLGPTWSLAVEEQFYLVVPLIVLWLRPRLAVPVLLLLAAMAPVLRYLYPSNYAFMMTPFRTDSLLFGSLLAYAMQDQRFVSLCRQYLWAIRAILVVLLAGIPVMMARRYWFVPFDFTWLSGFYLMLILLVQVSPRGLVARLVSTPVLLWFGAVSYAVYMFHEAVLGLIRYVILGNDPVKIMSGYGVAVTILAFGVTCGLAYLSGRYIEGPSRRFGHKWTYGGKSRRAQGGQPEISTL